MSLGNKKSELTKYRGSLFSSAFFRRKILRENEPGATLQWHYRLVV